MKSFHVNHAAVGQLSPHAVKSMAQAASALCESSFYPTVYPTLARRLNGVKSEIAHMLGAIDPSCLALTASTSDGFAALIQALPLREASTIAVGRSSFISVRAALSALSTRGIEIHEIGDARGCVRPEDIDRLPNDRISLIVVEWVNWLSGYRNDIHSLAAQCRETNIPLVVDAVQGLGAADIDYNLDDIGALICGGHKWLCGPEGTGFCYVAPWMHQRLRPVGMGYRAIVNAVDDLTGPIVPRRDTSVLEVGTQNTIGLLGLAAAIRPLRNNAYSQRVAYIREALSSIIEVLSAVPGIEFLTPLDQKLNAGIVSFRLLGVESHTLRQHFACHGIHCGVRQGWLRMSPGPECRSKGFRKQFKAAVKTVLHHIAL